MKRGDFFASVTRRGPQKVVVVYSFVDLLPRIALQQ
jgi:hypothetical protein